MCILTFLLLEVFQASSPILQANEIAHRLRISPKTVELHRSNIAKKTRATNIALVVRWAIRNKLMEP
jgi:DNA-binding NarL/FixJ family response regulator